MIKAAIFDLDGTIGDTVESIAYSGNRALRDIGYQAFPVENYKYYAGDGVDELVRRTLRDSGDTNCSQFEQMKSIYKAYFAKDCMYHVKPFPGICEMLSELKKRGIRMLRPSMWWRVCLEKIILITSRDRQKRSDANPHRTERLPLQKSLQ